MVSWWRKCEDVYHCTGIISFIGTGYSLKRGSLYVRYSLSIHKRCWERVFEHLCRKFYRRKFIHILHPILYQNWILYIIYKLLLNYKTKKRASSTKWKFKKGPSVNVKNAVPWWTAKIDVAFHVYILYVYSNIVIIKQEISNRYVINTIKYDISYSVKLDMLIFSVNISSVILHIFKFMQNSDNFLNNLKETSCLLCTDKEN